MTALAPLFAMTSMEERKPGAIGGFVAAGFEAVAEAFAATFGGEHQQGAAFAVYRGDEPLVDLWGGIADTRSDRPWAEDTIVLTFSGSKALASLCLLILIEESKLILGAPVSLYWPGFRSRATVADIMSHTAGLPGIDSPVAVEELVAGSTMAARLASQLRSPDPRASLCYHPLTFGWLVGELVRRVSGQSLGSFFDERIARPLELDIWFGLPQSEEPRIAWLELAEDWGRSEVFQPATWATDALIRSIWGNPPHFSAASFPWNRRDLHAAEIPGANAIGSARSIARLFGLVARGAVPFVSRATLDLARATLSEGYDMVHGLPRRFGVGFELQTALLHLGPPADAFGHAGAGGSVHGAWPRHGVGFSYMVNRLHDDSVARPVTSRLLECLDQCLGASPGADAQ